MGTAAIISGLLAALEGLPAISATISKMISDAEQSGELTADELAALRARQDAAMQSSAWNRGA